ncbi:MAG TPA: GDP-L-fucose synthase [Candidatus Babeliales bacterium]|nr:GDP-L-fucose synthase [Candidatus Babeliales bacterium]
MYKNAKIYVAGHCGLVGSAIMRTLSSAGYANLIVRDRGELDLCHQQAVQDFFASERPEYVFLAAAKVGGIQANFQYPAEFIYENVMIEANVIHASYQSAVKKLLFLGSSCIYPRACAQPIKEEYLLTGALEVTNEPYAIAKIAGITMCQAYNRQYGTSFISCMPTNIYGIHDNFNVHTSHVLPALLLKIHNAKGAGAEQVVVWGTGKPYREFLYVDDLADACLFLMNKYSGNEIINIGTGQDLMIADLVCIIKEIVGYEGQIVYDVSKPDGTLRKQLNVEKLHKLGWSAATSLAEGIQKTYDWCLKTGIFE